MPALFWGLVGIVVMVLGLALIAYRPGMGSEQGKAMLTGERGPAKPGAMWWITDEGGGD